MSGGRWNAGKGLRLLCAALIVASFFDWIGLCQSGEVGLTVRDR